jgi:hypothetical protein
VSLLKPSTATISHSSGVDKLVLATVNAPYRRRIDAAALAECLVKGELGCWAVHVATFFTDVSSDLVFEFATQHGIPKATLARAYLAVKIKTGESNPDLEAQLVTLAPLA